MPKYRILLKETEVRYVTYEIDSSNLDKAIELAKDSDGEVIYNVYVDTLDVQFLEAIEMVVK